MPTSSETAYGNWPRGAEVHVSWDAGQVSIRVVVDGAEASIQLDPDVGKRLFRDVHAKLGEP